MLVNKKTFFIVFCILSVAKTARERKLSFNDEQIKALKDELKKSGSGSRELDPAESLIQGKAGPGEIIDLAKHHIIPEPEIRAGLKKLANVSNLKQKMEQYFNDEKNIESKRLYLEQVGSNTEADWVMKSILRVMSWNPNNLRVGPKGGNRHRDPESGFDVELASKDQKQFYDNPNKNILEKLTYMASSKNPTWKKVASGKWEVDKSDGTRYSTTQLLKNGSTRYLYIKTGVVGN